MRKLQSSVDPSSAAFAANPGQLAGIIIEPVPGNAGHQILAMLNARGIEAPAVLGVGSNARG